MRMDWTFSRPKCNATSARQSRASLFVHTRARRIVRVTDNELDVIAAVQCWFTIDATHDTVVRHP